MKIINFGKTMGGAIAMITTLTMGVTPMTVFAQTDQEVEKVETTESVSDNNIDVKTEAVEDTEIPYSYTVDEDGNIVFSFNGEEYTYGAEEELTGTVVTGGSRLNVRTGAGMDYEVIGYELDPETEELDYKKIEELALEIKPKMIIAGASAYPRKIDFKKFREIADNVGAYLMVDMAHIAGLVAAGLHMNPVPYADVVTTTTHKTLRGPRGGLILTNDEEIIKKINKVIFPGIQGGPLMHVIAAKAQCFYEALQDDFKVYAKHIIENASAMANEFKKQGVRIISGGTDNHLMLIDVKSSFGITGDIAEKTLDSICITVNKNSIPNDDEKPSKTSGLRIGTPAMTTRGLNEKDFIYITDIIVEALKNYDNKSVLKELKKEVLEITSKYPTKNIK